MQRSVKKRDENDIEEGGRTRSMSPNPAGAHASPMDIKAASGDQRVVSSSWGSVLQPLAGGLLMLFLVLVLGSFMREDKHAGVHRVAPAKRDTQPQRSAVQHEAPSFAAPLPVPSLPSIVKDDQLPAAKEHEEFGAVDDKSVGEAETFTRQDDHGLEADETEQSRDMDEDEEDAFARIKHKWREEEEDFEADEDGQDHGENFHEKEQEDHAAQEEVDAAQHDGDVSQHGDDAAQHEGDAAQHEGDAGDAAQHEGDAAQHEGDAAQHEGDAAQHEGDAAQHEGDAAQHEGDAASDHIDVEDEKACEGAEDFHDCMLRKQAEDRLEPMAHEVEESNWFQDSFDYFTTLFGDDDAPKERITAEEARAEHHLEHMKPLEEFEEEALGDVAEGGRDEGGRDTDVGEVHTEEKRKECDPDDEECFHRLSEQRLKPHALPELNEEQDPNWFKDSFDYVASLFGSEGDDEYTSAGEVPRKMSHVQGEGDIAVNQNDAHGQGNAWRESAQHVLHDRQQVLQGAKDMTEPNHEVREHTKYSPREELIKAVKTLENIGQAMHVAEDMERKVLPVDPFSTAAATSETVEDDDGGDEQDGHVEIASPDGSEDNNDAPEQLDSEQATIVHRPEEEHDKDNGGW